MKSSLLRGRRLAAMARHAAAAKEVLLFPLKKIWFSQ